MMTIASDDEVEVEQETDSESDGASVAVKPTTKSGKKRQRQQRAKQREGPVDPGFCFDVESSLGIAESQAVKGWDFKSEWSVALRFSCAMFPEAAHS